MDRIRLKGEYGPKLFRSQNKGKTMSDPKESIESKMESSLEAAKSQDAIVPGPTPTPPAPTPTPTPPVAAAPTPPEAAAPTPPVEAPTPVSAPTPPAGAVNIGNVAASLDPTAHAQAAQQVVVNDEFNYDVAFNLAFVGSGQGGARLDSSFYDLGYRRVGLFNTAESDFQGLPDAIERHTLDLAVQPKTLVLPVSSTGEKKGWDLLQRSWGNDMDYGLVCVGLGGGTGSGTSSKIVGSLDMLR